MSCGSADGRCRRRTGHRLSRSPARGERGSAFSVTMDHAQRRGCAQPKIWTKKTQADIRLASGALAARDRQGIRKANGLLQATSFERRKVHGPHGYPRRFFRNSSCAKAGGNGLGMEVKSGTARNLPERPGYFALTGPENGPTTIGPPVTGPTGENPPGKKRGPLTRHIHNGIAGWPGASQPSCR